MEPFQTLREEALREQALGNAGDRFTADTVVNVLHAWDVALCESGAGVPRERWYW